MKPEGVMKLSVKVTVALERKGKLIELGFSQLNLTVPPLKARGLVRRYSTLKERGYNKIIISPVDSFFRLVSLSVPHSPTPVV